MPLEKGSTGDLEQAAAAPTRQWMNMIIYGGWGAGKTHLAGSAALVEEMCPVLYLDVEDGAMTIEQNYDLNKITVKPIDKWSHFEREIRKIRAEQKYRSVIVDNATEAQNFDFAEILGENMDTLETDSQPAWGDYNISTNHLSKLARSLRRLPCHVIVTAWEKETADNKGNLETITLQLSNKASKQFPGHFDSVFYLYTERRGGRNKRYLLTEDGSHARARTRVRGMPSKIEDPTMRKVFDYTFGGGPEEAVEDDKRETKGDQK